MVILKLGDILLEERVKRILLDGGVILDLNRNGVSSRVLLDLMGQESVACFDCDSLDMGVILSDSSGAYKIGICGSCFRVVGLTVCHEG